MKYVLLHSHRTIFLGSPVPANFLLLGKSSLIWVSGSGSLHLNIFTSYSCSPVFHNCQMWVSPKYFCFLDLQSVAYSAILLACDQCNVPLICMGINGSTNCKAVENYGPGKEMVKGWQLISWWSLAFQNWNGSLFWIF